MTDELQQLIDIAVDDWTNGAIFTPEERENTQNYFLAKFEGEERKPLPKSPAVLMYAAFAEGVTWGIDTGITIASAPVKESAEGATLTPEEEKRVIEELTYIMQHGSEESKQKIYALLAELEKAK